MVNTLAASDSGDLLPGREEVRERDGGEGTRLAQRRMEALLRLGTRMREMGRLDWRLILRHGHRPRLGCNELYRREIDVKDGEKNLVGKKRHAHTQRLGS